MVRAKFVVIRTESTLMQKYKDPNKGWQKDNLENVELKTIVFSPVSGGSEENIKFWEATPSGEIKLGIVKPEAWGEFVLGKDYYIDFSAA